MLNSNIGWVSPSYKPRLAKAEKENQPESRDAQDDHQNDLVSSSTESILTGRNKTLHIRRPFSANTNAKVTIANTKQPWRRSAIPRTRSAPPRARIGAHSSSISSNSPKSPASIPYPSPARVVSQEDEKPLEAVGTVYSSFASIYSDRPISGTSGDTNNNNNALVNTGDEVKINVTPSVIVDKSVQDSINLYSQQMVPRTVENAAFRHRTGSANQNYITRPMSGRMPASSTRPLGKCRNAWGEPSNGDNWQPAFSPSPPAGRAGTPQSDMSEEELLFFKENKTSGLGSSITHFTPEGGTLFPPGASMDDRASSPALYRPASSCERNAGNPLHCSSPDGYIRSKSACSYRSKSPGGPVSRSQTPDELLAPWLEDPRIGLSVGFQMDPTLVYFDRHSRCHNHNHLHHPLLLYRPQPACDSSVDTCGKFKTETTRPDSAMSMRTFSRKHGHNTTLVQRYINTHRPRTAPHTVRLKDI